MIQINTARLLATFLELVGIDSPSGKEAKVAAYCQVALEEAGCVVRFDDTEAQTGSNTGNLFATLPAYGSEYVEGTSAKPLYFSAHMDTVVPGIGVKPIIKDGVVYSDGTTVLGGDDKGGIAAILEMIRIVKEEESQGIAHPEIKVLLSVKEELSLVGAKAMDAQEFASAQGAFCYVLDAAGKPGLIINGAPYQYTYRAVYKGLAAHAGIAPQTGVSAIRAAANAVVNLPQGRLDDRTTANVGTIRGGAANNIVAEDCIITGEFRSHDEDRVLALKKTVQEVLEEAAKDDTSGAGPSEVAISWEVNYEGFYVPEDAPQVRRALSAAQKLGLEPQAEISGGGADTNILVSYGLAAVSLGCGMECVHSTEERMAIKDLEDLARLAVGIVRENEGGD